MGLKIVLFPLRLLFLNDAMAAFFWFRRPQQRHDTAARDVRADEVPDPTVTTETSKMTTSAMVASPSAAVGGVWQRRRALLHYVRRCVADRAVR
jgi:hypothetical protein